jgi:hypothetical protein
VKVCSNPFFFGKSSQPCIFPVRLLQTLTAVQVQLHGLEEENAISRRRVRELEMELEECKRDVARERTRLFEREESRKGDVSYRRPEGSKAKGKSKAKEISNFGLAELDDERLKTRYKEAVEEKKGQCYVRTTLAKLIRIPCSFGSIGQFLALPPHSALF